MEPNDRIKAQLMDKQDLDRTLERMARQIDELIDPDENDIDDFALIGMQTRGVYLARRLREKIRNMANHWVQANMCFCNMR